MQYDCSERLLYYLLFLKIRVPIWSQASHPALLTGHQLPTLRNA